MKWLKNIWHVLKHSIPEFMRTEPMIYSGSIAFYTIFSLPAVLMMIISIAGSLYGEASVRIRMLEYIRQLAGSETAQRVREIVDNTGIAEPNTLANVISISVLLFSATTVFSILQESLNVCWGVKRDNNADSTKSDIIGTLISRGVSLVIIIILGTIMATTVLLETIIAILNDFIVTNFPQLSIIFRYSNLLLSTVVLVGVFSVIYKVLPGVLVKWRDVVAGAIVSTVLFVVGKYLMGVYLAGSPITSAYGAAGSLVVLLIWVFYSGFIVLYGATFSKVHAYEFGRIPQTKKRAIKGGMALQDEKKQA